VVDFTSTNARAKKLSLNPTRRGPGRGHRAKIPMHITSAHCQLGGHNVPSTGGNPCHHCCVGSGVCSLVSDQLDSPLGSSGDKLAKVQRSSIHDKVGTITSCRLHIPGPTVATARMAQARCPINVGRVHGKADRTTSSRACLRSHVASPPSTPPTMR
jgi:hypothetical protein